MLTASSPSRTCCAISLLEFCAAHSYTLPEHPLTPVYTRRFNPGRIDPTNEAWDASRKPLVAAWETPSGARFFTINLHLTSKGGSSSSQGDARPPVNGGVDQRASQVAAVAVSSSGLISVSVLEALFFLFCFYCWGFLCSVVSVDVVRLSDWRWTELLT